MTEVTDVVAKPAAPGRRRAQPKQGPVNNLGLWIGALVVAQSLVLLDLDVPVLRPLFALLTLVGLPVLVVFRRASLPAETSMVRFLYSLGLVLLGVILGGLVVNTVFPVFGNDRPLSAGALGLVSLVADIALLCWRRSVPLVPPYDGRQVLQRVWDARVEPAQALAVAGVFLSVIGAVRLNNGLGGQVAVLALLLVIAAFVVLLVREGSPGRDVRTIFLATAALLLATSLRGWGVTGHDVQAEFFVYGLTSRAGHWSMDLFHNAYTACLSVTLLPTTLSKLTALSGTVWFKVGLQVLFAVVPVTTFLAARRFVSRRLALVATTFVVGFPTFHVDMPYLVRQEVAFVFLALMLLVVTERGASLWVRRGLAVAFGTGMLLSHYSTTYFLLGGLFLALVLMGLLTLLMRRTGRTDVRRPLTLLHPAVVLVLAALTVTWAGPITDTGDQPLKVAKDAVTALLGKGDSQPGSSDRGYFLLGGATVSERERLDQFVAETLQLRKEAPKSLVLVKKLGPAELKPKLVEPQEAPVTPAGTALDKVGVDPGTVVNASRFLAAGVVQILLMLGVLWVVLAGWRLWRGKPSRSKPDDEVQDSVVGLELVALVLGVLGSLAMVVVVPSLSVEYGVLRAFLQSMLILAPVAAVGLWWALTKVRRTAWVVGVAVVLMAILTSAAPALIGGGPAKLALANSGLYYDRYIVADSDEKAAERIGEAPDTSAGLPRVIAPRHQAIRVIQAGVKPDDISSRTYPTLLNVGSYVFSDARLTTTKQDTVFYSGDRLTYRYPTQDLDNLLDLVYCAGNSRVYR